MLSTNNTAIKKILRDIDFSAANKFYDLGAGNGKLISHIAKRYPGLECVGIEYNLVAYCCARLRNVFSRKKVIYRRGNFFEIDISDANIIYTYLFPNIMNRLEIKFARELKKGTLVIVNSFPLKSREPKTIIQGKAGALDTFYVYEY